jgi:hypothetical protein
LVAEPALWSTSITERGAGATIVTVRQNGSQGISRIELSVMEALRNGFDVVFGDNGGSIVILYYGKNEKVGQ